MSTRMAPRMIQVTFRHPEGSVRLAAPADVPLGELMPDFLDLAEQPDGVAGRLAPTARMRIQASAHSPSSVSSTAACSSCTDTLKGYRRRRRQAGTRILRQPDSPAVRSGRCASGRPARCRRSSRGRCADGSPSTRSRVVGRAATLPGLPARAFPARGRSPVRRAPPPLAGPVRRGATPTISNRWMI